MKTNFLKFREGIIGIDTKIPSSVGEPKTILYADWTASGRNYLPIEKRIQDEIMPLVANTHTDTSATGMAMTHAYHEAQKNIKKHVNASADDLILTTGSGMTGVVNKLQRILGMKTQDKYCVLPPEEELPVVFITHMEHHSNQTSWLETNATVEIINPTKDGLVDLNHLKTLVEKYKNREVKIASVTSASNVTGITTNYHEMAKIMHHGGGLCFVDFACSAPYVDINMHPAEDGSHLDAIYFSPHKFMGGPGSTGVLVFNKKLYNKDVPDSPGGGTVDWTNPWGEHKYIDDIEIREDGGTPAFIQTIKAAMCITLKEEMGTENIAKREDELLELIWDRMVNTQNIHVLADNHKKRLPIISFYIDNLHFNLAVRMLNDRFGIQSRGGCSCAGTYGHYLLHVTKEQSHRITDLVNRGDLSEKPGWIRISLHPTMTDAEVTYLADSILDLAKNHEEWCKDYDQDAVHGTLKAKSGDLDGPLKLQIESALTRDFIS